MITIDGSTGQVSKGNAKMVQPKLSKNFFEILNWASGLGKIMLKQMPTL